MDFVDYQRLAEETDQNTGAVANFAEQRVNDDHIVVPLLGLVGEVGNLQTEYKKYLRDGSAYSAFEENLAEELGDILWYVANLATKFGLDLQEVAEANLVKTQGRWSDPPRLRELPDRLFPEDQRLPRRFDIQFHQLGQETAANGPPKVQCYWNGRPFGNRLDDNSTIDDGYRYHDAFHLAYLVRLGWSPVLRKFFGATRHGDIDRVRDGGRAKVIEEAIAAIVYSHAEKVDWFRGGIETVDLGLLKLIQQMTGRIEELDGVTLREWEVAILTGYNVWNQLVRNGGGLVTGDIDSGLLSCSPLPENWIPPTYEELGPSVA